MIQLKNLATNQIFDCQQKISLPTNYFVASIKFRYQCWTETVETKPLNRNDGIKTIELTRICEKADMLLSVLLSQELTSYCHKLRSE